MSNRKTELFTINILRTYLRIGKGSLTLVSFSFESSSDRHSVSLETLHDRSFNIINKKSAVFKKSTARSESFDMILGTPLRQQPSIH